MNENWLLNYNNETYKYAINVLAGALNIWLPAYTCYCSHLRFIVSLYVLMLSYIVYCYPILIPASLYVSLLSYIVYCYPMRFPALLNRLLKEEGFSQMFPAIFFFSDTIDLLMPFFTFYCFFFFKTEPGVNRFILLLSGGWPGFWPGFWDQKIQCTVLPGRRTQ